MSEVICALCDRAAHYYPWVYKYGLECPGTIAEDQDKTELIESFKQELAWRTEVDARFGNDVASRPDLTEALLKRRAAVLNRAENTPEIPDRVIPEKAVVSTTQVAHVNSMTGTVTQEPEIAEVLAEPLEYEISVPESMKTGEPLVLDEKHFSVPGEVPEDKTPLRPRHTAQNTKHQSSDYMLWMKDEDDE